jgi:hypothetical protein
VIKVDCKRSRKLKLRERHGSLTKMKTKTKRKCAKIKSLYLTNLQRNQLSESKLMQYVLFEMKRYYICTSKGFLEVICE